MEINKDHPSENKERLLRAFDSKGDGHHLLCFDRDRKRHRSGKALLWKKEKVQLWPSGGCCPGEAVGRLTRSGVSYMIDRGVWLSLAYSYVGTGDEN